MEKTKKIWTVSVLALFLVGGCLLHLLLPDGEFSKSERRKLLQRPEITKVTEMKKHGSFCSFGNQSKGLSPLDILM